MRGVVFLAGLLLAFVAVAGCSDDGGDKDTPSTAGPDAQDVTLDADASVGAISGVIVDEAIRPIAGALVTLLGKDRNVTTTSNGQFVFEDLDPGVYFMQVNITGYAPLQTSADVKAGEVAHPRVVLQRLTVKVPYHQTLQHTGFIQLSPGVAGPIVNILIDTGLGMENPLCTCTLMFNTTGLDVKTIVVEAQWEDSLPSPTGASTLYLEVFPRELDDGTSDIQGGFLPSPILQHYPIEAWGENETNVEWNARLTGDAFTVQYNQQYQLFVTLFIDGPAPEGWSLVKGDV